MVDPMLHQGLVHTVAGWYAGRGMEHEDLVQEGQFGLLRACREFDPALGHRFSTLATHYIRTTIHWALRAQSRMVRIPANQYHILSRVRRGVVDPDAMTIKQRECYRRAMAASTAACPLDNRTHGTLPLDALAEMEQTELREAVQHGLQNLHRRYRDILSMYYGLDGGEPTSMEAVGTHFGISRERVRQILVKCHKRLKTKLATYAA